MLLFFPLGNGLSNEHFEISNLVSTPFAMSDVFCFYVDSKAACMHVT